MNVWPLQELKESGELEQMIPKAQSLDDRCIIFVDCCCMAE